MGTHTESLRMSFFADTIKIPADGLLSLIGEFKADPSPDKIDLGVGVYQNEDGKTPIFNAVRQAHAKLTETEDSKSYVGPMGWPGFAAEVKRLILGQELERKIGKRVAVMPTPGSGGALKVAGVLVRRLRPNSKVWLGRPTWVNHKPIFNSCELQIAEFAYYDHDGASIDRQRMHTDLSQASAGEIVVAHGCCHNPTGEDFNQDDWSLLGSLAIDKGVIPLIDVAYHGLGTGFDSDMAETRTLLSKIPEAILTYSFSKHMGLYRERVGAIAVLTENAETAERVQSNLTEIARQSYSMPPSYGEALAHFVLTDRDMRSSWLAELEAMRVRVQSIRNDVSAALADSFGDNRFNYIRTQSGMFSMLPLSSEQIVSMKADASIYMAPDGRINLCGFTAPKIERFTEVMQNIMRD